MSIICVYLFLCMLFFFFKQKTAYEMRISDWSSDVCSSDLMTRLSSFVPGDPIPQDFVEAAEAVQAVMYEIVEQRRANPGPDLISTLITDYDEGENLTDAELIGKIGSIVTAGIGETAKTLSGAIWLLCRHPNQIATQMDKQELKDK